jgi:molybdenum cofactor cytidylyltransferase
LRFGPVAVPEALGCVLAHTTRLPGLVLRKGTVLDIAALDALAEAGIAQVIAARLDAGDVAEDAAALRIAEALLRPGMALGRPGSGRVNLVAAHAGLFRAEAPAIDAINAVHEGITVATLDDATPVRAGELVATVKIIPFALRGDTVALAEHGAAESRAVRLPAFRPLRVGLIVTDLPGMKPSVAAATMRVTRERIERLGGTLLLPLTVPHETSAVSEALTKILPGADLLLIAGASAVMDRLDVAPAGIVAAGGRIEHFGMPVDPGNLICLGHIGAVPALVLPGCARSPKRNGIDFMLHRLFAGEPAGGAEIMRMGVGGLLKEFAARPMPRRAAPSPKGQVAAVVLAAGLSSRMAPANKLLVTDANGVSMVARVVDAVLASRAAPALVVVGHQAEAVRASLAGRTVAFVHAADYATGMAASLRAGVTALPASACAALICLGDMPLVGAPLLDLLIETYDPDEGRLIVVPKAGGKRGNPVLWDRRFFADMAQLTGDVGARALLRTHGEAVFEVETGDEGVLTDYDTPTALAPKPEGPGPQTARAPDDFPCHTTVTG